MPRYDFKCTKCEQIEQDVFISADVINKNSNWNKHSCPACNNPSEVCLLVAPQFFIKGWSPDRSRRAVKRFDQDYSIMEEGFSSTAEVQESQAIAKEEEKRLGLDAGSLSGVSAKAATPEEATSKKKKAADRAKQARKQRGCQ
jgi:hypothetical protein